MLEENMNQEFRLKKIDESINYLIEETSWNKLRSKKHKKGLVFLITLNICLLQFL